MKTLEVEVPDQLAEEIEKLVKSGWFLDENEVVQFALADFIRRHSIKVYEQSLREDILWALSLKDMQR